MRGSYTVYVTCIPHCCSCGWCCLLLLAYFQFGLSINITDRRICVDRYEIMDEEKSNSNDIKEERNSSKHVT